METIRERITSTHKLTLHRQHAGLLPKDFCEALAGLVFKWVSESERRKLKMIMKCMQMLFILTLLFNSYFICINLCWWNVWRGWDSRPEISTMHVHEMLKMALSNFLNAQLDGTNTFFITLTHAHCFLHFLPNTN